MAEVPAISWRVRVLAALMLALIVALFWDTLDLGAIVFDPARGGAHLHHHHGDDATGVHWRDEKKSQPAAGKRTAAPTAGTGTDAQVRQIAEDTPQPTAPRRRRTAPTPPPTAAAPTRTKPVLLHEARAVVEKNSRQRTQDAERRYYTLEESEALFTQLPNAALDAQKYSASSTFRVIRGVDVINGDFGPTAIYYNMSLDECRQRCVDLGRTSCSYFSRTISSSLQRYQRLHTRPTAAAAAAANAATISPPTLVPLPHFSPFAGDTWSSLTHGEIDRYIPPDVNRSDPDGAANELIRAEACAYSEKHLAARSTYAAPDDFYAERESHFERTLERCALFIGVPNLVPSPHNEVWLPDTVRENTNIVVLPPPPPPARGAANDAQASQCPAASQVPPLATRLSSSRRRASAPSPSSLLAVGLHVRPGAAAVDSALATLRTWLRDEPNAAVFLHRRPSHVGKITELLERLHRRSAARADTTSVEAVVVNELFDSCVDPFKLLAVFQHMDGEDIGEAAKDCDGAALDASNTTLRFAGLPLVDGDANEVAGRKGGLREGHVAYDDDDEWDALLHGTRYSIRARPLGADDAVRNPNDTNATAAIVVAAASGVPATTTATPQPQFVGAEADVDGDAVFGHAGGGGWQVADTWSMTPRRVAHTQNVSRDFGIASHQRTTVYPQLMWQFYRGPASWLLGRVAPKDRVAALRKAASTLPTCFQQRVTGAEFSFDLSRPLPNLFGGRGFNFLRFLQPPTHRFVVAGDNAAWKHLRVVFELGQFFPSVAWYLVANDRTYVLTRTLRYMLLLGSLSQHHRRSRYYYGFVSHVHTLDYVDAEAGMLIPHATMHTASKRIPLCMTLCRQPYGDVRVSFPAQWDPKLGIHVT